MRGVNWSAVCAGVPLWCMSFAEPWLDYFERNRLNRLPLPDRDEVAVEARLRAKLVRSLQRE